MTEKMMCNLETAELTAELRLCASNPADMVGGFTRAGELII